MLLCDKQSLKYYDNDLSCNLQDNTIISALLPEMIILKINFHR